MLALAAVGAIVHAQMGQPVDEAMECSRASIEGVVNPLRTEGDSGIWRARSGRRDDCRIAMAIANGLSTPAGERRTGIDEVAVDVQAHHTPS